MAGTVASHAAEAQTIPFGQPMPSWWLRILRPSDIPESEQRVLVKGLAKRYIRNILAGGYSNYCQVVTIGGLTRKGVFFSVFMRLHQSEYMTAFFIWFSMI